MTERSPGTQIRSEFPIFDSAKGKYPLAFLDSAASSQKPQCVIGRLSNYLAHEHANIHRGAYQLSVGATENYEEARRSIERFIGAEEDSVIFTRGTTESINLVSYSLSEYFEEGDVILLSVLEHHSNIVPWQLLAQRKKLHLHYVDCDDYGSLHVDAVAQAIKKHKPKLVAITQQSNALGTVVDSAAIGEICAAHDILFLVDGAQGVAHMDRDLKDMKLDFYAFSGHKLYGPTGIGGLYVSPKALTLLTPFMGGGDMIETVSLEGSTFAEGIQRFEAGTPPIAEAIALGEAVAFVESIGRTRIHDHEQELFQYAWDQLSNLPGIRLLGPHSSGGVQQSILSFLYYDLHPHDIATIADSYNVQFRAGHHCAMPLMKRLGLAATSRISFGVYSTREDVDQLKDALQGAKKIFKIED